MTFLFYFQPFIMDGYFITKNERSIRFMKKNEPHEILSLEKVSDIIKELGGDN